MRKRIDAPRAFAHETPQGRLSAADAMKVYDEAYAAAFYTAWKWDHQIARKGKQCRK